MKLSYAFPSFCHCYANQSGNICVAIVADDVDRECYFASSTDPTGPGPSSSISSLEDPHVNDDPFNFTLYIDQVWSLISDCHLIVSSDTLCSIILGIQAPLTIQTNSPLELVQQLFAKLGAKYVIVTDPTGHCESFIILRFHSFAAETICSSRRRRCHRKERMDCVLE